MSLCLGLGFVVVLRINVGALGSAKTVWAAPASGITVTTTTDELNHNGDCSLREAIQAANTDGGLDGSNADTIDLPARTYTLTIAGGAENNNATGDLDIPLTLIPTGTSLSPGHHLSICRLQARGIEIPSQNA